MQPSPTAVVWRAGDGPHATLHAAAAAAGRADLAVVWPGVTPHGDWLARLADAAHVDGVVASASALLTGGRWAPAPLDGAADVERTAASVAERSLRLRPRIGEPQPGCVLLRRDALDLAGPDADERLSVTAAVLAFGERCSALGLGHVLADDVLADGAAPAASGDELEALDAAHPHRAAARALDEQRASPVRHALLAASRGLDALSVTIDGRALGPARAGTQVHALELIAALGRSGRVRLRVITPPDLDPQAAAALARLDDVSQLPYDAAANARPGPTDVVHRPNQVFSAADLALLLPLGERLVVTHQDLIAYRIATYHDSVDDWLSHRRITANTLAAADRVVFFSEHARADALADLLVDPAQAAVIPIGVDHAVSTAGDEPPRRPAALPDDELPFLLCLGTSLRHKNHAFAAALARRLRDAAGWDGRLVLAGPSGTFSDHATVPAQPHGVVHLGPVSEPEKLWLLGRAAAVAYPTLYEGFGLIPFEAAAAGTPCLFAARSSLAELLPRELATLVPWDAAASAAAVAPLLRAGAARDAHVDAVRAAARRYRWDATAAALVDLYEDVVAAPPRELQRGPAERLEIEQRLLVAIEARNVQAREFRDAVGADAAALIGPGGLLGAADQRALLALLIRRPLRAPALALVRAAYRVAHGLPGRGRRRR